MTDKDLEQIFGGLYYEQNGSFHPVHNHPRYIKRVQDYGEEVAKQTREEVIEECDMAYERAGKRVWDKIDVLSSRHSMPNMACMTVLGELNVEYSNELDQLRSTQPKEDRCLCHCHCDCDGYHQKDNTTILKWSCTHCVEGKNV